MTQRLSPLDAAFWFAERPTAALHVGAVLMLGPPADRPFDAAGFTASVQSRLDRLPRLRQRVRAVPGRLGLPVWVDDDRFDPAYHLRHVALPGPGGEHQLRTLVDGLMEAPLDRDRPLWEMTLVDGLPGGRTAVVVKIHHAMADGLSCLDLAAVLLDRTSEPTVQEYAEWSPVRAPSGLFLATEAAFDGAATARAALSVGVGVLRAVRDGSGRAAAAHVAGSAVAAALQATRTPIPALHGGTGSRRRHVTVATPLADHRSVRRALGGTVHDVVLAVLAGALRSWLQRRGQRLSAATTVRAMVPVSVRGRSRTGAGNEISAHFVDLPVGLADPLARFATVRAAMDERKRRGPVAAATVARLADVSPPLLHELGARVAGRHVGRLYDVLVTTLPGPPRVVYAHGAPLLDLFPMVPLGSGQAVAFGVVTCAGNADYGITADHDAVADVDALADALRESLAELVERAGAASFPESSSTAPGLVIARRELMAELGLGPGHGTSRSTESPAMASTDPPV